MKASLLICESGIVVFDAENNRIVTRRFAAQPLYTGFSRILAGEMTEELEEVLREAAKAGVDSVAVKKDLTKTIPQDFLEITEMPEESFQRMWEGRVKLMVEAGLVNSEEEAFEIIRGYALHAAEGVVRDLSGKPDLHLIQAIQSLDEVSRSVNKLSSRITEWYGLHFPELQSILEDQREYAKFVAKIGDRSHVTYEKLSELGFSDQNVKAVVAAAERSKGGEAATGVLRLLSIFAQEFESLSLLSEKLTEQVEETMSSLAPNLTSVAGATVGARLVAKVGGLERLAKLPASTVQVLGAEKALFRALKTGGRPPKHGIIFQHHSVHSAPKWQRGKIARSLAGKMAIAARVDAFRGSLEPAIKEDLARRVDEIRVKYSEQPVSVAEKRERRQRRHSRYRR